APAGGQRRGGVRGAVAGGDREAAHRADAGPYRLEQEPGRGHPANRALDAGPQDQELSPTAVASFPRKTLHRPKALRELAPVATVQEVAECPRDCKPSASTGSVSLSALLW